MSARLAASIRWAALACFLASAGLLVATLPIADWLELVRGRIASLGVWAPLAYALLYAAAATLFMPGSALSLAAGLLFGVWLGTAVVWCGATAAIALSFLIARYAARGKVEEMARTRPRFAAVDRAIGEQGWKIVALLRLSPVFPFSLQNYLYGITAIRFFPCLVASAVFIVPGTFLYVYLGFAGGEAAVAAGGGADTLRLVLQIAGLLATAAVTIGIARIAGKAIASHAPNDPSPARPAKQAAARARPVKSLVLLLLGLACLAATLVAYRSKGSLLNPEGTPAAHAAGTVASAAAHSRERAEVART